MNRTKLISVIAVLVAAVGFLGYQVMQPRVPQQTVEFGGTSYTYRDYTKAENVMIGEKKVFTLPNQ